jgi:hypothetical protein
MPVLYAPPAYKRLAGDGVNAIAPQAMSRRGV